MRIYIEQSHLLPIEKAVARLHHLGDRLAAEHGINSTWVDVNHAHVEGKGVTGSISSISGEVIVDLDVSWTLALVKKKIEKTIREELQNALAVTG